MFSPFNSITGGEIEAMKVKSKLSDSPILARGEGVRALTSGASRELPFNFL
jgi:hypothetical protein